MAGAVTTVLTWGRRLTWGEALSAEAAYSLIVGADDRRAIARDIDLEALEHLEASVSVRSWLDGVELDGHLRARLTRLCGLSLEPFQVDVDESFRIRIVPMGSVNAPLEDAPEIVVDLEAEDPPDVATEGVVDISAYVLETLALSLDPFPRKPGAVFTSPEPNVSLSPFAGLAERVRRES